MTILHLAPSNDSALAHLRRRIRQTKAADPLAPVHLLLPSARVIDRLRRDLGDALNVHFLQFYGLARAVLAAARQDHIHEIGDTTSRRLVHHVLGQMAEEGQLSTFAAVRQKPGFVDVILSWLREMKSRGIHPEDVAREAERTGTLHMGAERDRQLAGIYQRYQSFLHQGDLSDADGLLWLAAESLAGQPDCFHSGGPLFVYGFDQVNPVQMDLLAGLAGCFRQIHIYLLWDEDRPPGSLTLTRLRETRRGLSNRLSPQVEVLPPAPLPPTIAHLNRSLFEADVPPLTAGDDLVLIEAPSREAEVRAALRSIKALLLDGVSPRTIALLAPQPGIYRRLVETVAHEYGVPVAVESVLGANPAVAAFLNALRLSPAFPWRQTIDLLRSPYVDVTAWLSPDQIDRLDRLTRERPVVAGVEQWRHALRPVELPAGSDEEDEDRGQRPLVADLPRETLSAIEQGLLGLFRHLTPPPQASPVDYVLWLQDAILGLPLEVEPDAQAPPEEPPSLHLLSCGERGAYAERDRRALSLLLRALRQMVAAAQIVPPPGTVVEWATFRSDLLNSLPAVPIFPEDDRAAVPFDALEGGRGLTPKHLFVLGLSEGEFPAPPAADVLYAPQERIDSPLGLRRVQPGEDASLWWQIVGNVGTRLTLLRAWLDENGALWPPSPYWQAIVESCVDLNATRLRVAESPAPSQAASLGELSVALASAGAGQAPAELLPQWRLAQRAATVLAQRHSWRPPGPFEGVIGAEDLRDELAQRYGPDHIWSASRLNRYNTCPFGFFVQHILKLEPRPDPEEGLDARQRGGLLHTILEKLYQRFTQQGIVPGPQTEARALALLEACCADTFRDAPQRYGFRPGPLWQQEQTEMHRQLDALLRWECATNGENPRFQPLHQELGFGIGRVHPPVTLGDGNGRTIRLRGVIDRIDRDADGDLRVVDYKSGSSKYYGPDISEGRSVQTALYALAAGQILGDVTIQTSVYLHIPKRETSGEIDRNKSHFDERLAGALKAALDAAEHVRAGRFPNAPSKREGRSGACASWCDLAAICRVTRHSVAKGRPLLQE